MLAQALPTALFTRPAPSLKDEEDHRDAARPKAAANETACLPQEMAMGDGQG